MTWRDDAYIQWIEYSRLSNMQETTSLRRECTLIAKWLELTTDEPTRVTLKQIVDGQNAQSFDFYQVNYFTCKHNAIDKCVSYFNINCILYTQIANQGIPRDINTREYLDTWNYSGSIYSRILFNFLSRRTCTVGQVHTMLQ